MDPILGCYMILLSAGAAPNVLPVVDDEARCTGAQVSLYEETEPPTEPDPEPDPVEPDPEPGTTEYQCDVTHSAFSNDVTLSCDVTGVQVAGDGTLDVELHGDFVAGNHEYAWVVVEGDHLPRPVNHSVCGGEDYANASFPVLGPIRYGTEDCVKIGSFSDPNTANAQCMDIAWIGDDQHPARWTIPQADLERYAADGVIEVRFRRSDGVNKCTEDNWPENEGLPNNNETIMSLSFPVS